MRTRLLLTLLPVLVALSTAMVATGFKDVHRRPQGAGDAVAVGARVGVPQVIQRTAVGPPLDEAPTVPGVDLWIAGLGVPGKQPDQQGLEMAVAALLGDPHLAPPQLFAAHSA